METQHNHYAYVFNILHDFLFIVFVLFQPVSYESEGSFVACVQTVFPVKFKFNIFISFVEGIVGQVHHYFFIVVFWGGLVFFRAESWHAFICKEDCVGMKVGYEEVEAEIEFESIDY